MPELHVAVIVDRRPRIKVLLIADGRPRYYTFFCVRCGLGVCEVSGNVIGISDVTSASPAPVAIECRRKFCRTVYEFEELSN